MAKRKRMSQPKWAKVSSIHLKDLEEIDPREKSTEALYAMVKTMSRIANRRLRNLERRGLAEYSPAYKYRRGGELHRGKVKYFDTKLKNPVATQKNLKRGKGVYRDQLLAMHTELYTFLFQAKTTTIEGAEKFKRNLEKRFDRDYWRLTKSQRKDFWDTYHKFLESSEIPVSKDKDAGGVITSSSAQRVLYDFMFESGVKGGKKKPSPGINQDITLEYMKDYLENLEEEKARKNAEKEEIYDTLSTSIGGEDESDEDNPNEFK